MPAQRTIYLRNGMDAGVTFCCLARELAHAEYARLPGYRRRDFAAQAYCAAYVLTQKYAVPAPPFQFDRITADLAGEEPQLQRQFLSDVKTTAYSVSRQLGRGLREPLEQTVSADYEFTAPATGGHPRSRPDRLNADEPEVFPFVFNFGMAFSRRVIVVLMMKKATYNSRAPPGRLEETMRRNIRIMKMDRNNRTILMRALYADFCANRAAGLSYDNLAALITRLHETQPGKLPLDDAEYRLARNALNHLRNERIATGGYTDAADAALLKLVKAKPPLWPFG